jgi:uncharacterized protein involved in exopolysaccharide biosynthesis
LDSAWLAGKLESDSSFRSFLFGKEWDADKELWRQPRGLIAGIRGAIAQSLGRPRWQPPGPAQVQQTLQNHLKVQYVREEGLLTLSLSASNPQLATRLLNKVILDCDAIVRSQSEQDAKLYVQYASQKLEKVTNTELRTALLSVIENRERTLVLAGVDVPFSITVVDPVSASSVPAGPSIKVDMGIGAVSGLLLGFLVSLLWPNRWSPVTPYCKRLTGLVRSQ